ncbi:hypothetical protein M3Y97_00676600 [Aphelenchoides bicaudatus]|nr:hypothetical protein M3Y97_00676600 [Aphelenchoides bicaudatus]
MTTSSLQYDLYDFVCTYHHRVRKLAAKDAQNAPASASLLSDAQNDAEQMSNEQRGEQMNRLLYKILNEIEQRIGNLPGGSELSTAEYFDEWAFLTWSLLSIINRLQRDGDDSKTFLDYGGKHFQEKIHAALVDLVNKAQRMQSPLGAPMNEQFERFYQAYVTSLISLHDLYTLSQQKWQSNEFEAQIHLFKEQLASCFQFQREFCNSHRFFVWQQLRSSQIHKMTKYNHNNKGFLSMAMSFYTHMLYNLGVLTARLQVTMGVCFDERNNKGFTKPELIQPLLHMVYNMVDMLISDSIVCIEPSQNSILVTNNLFPVKVVSLCQCTLYKRFQFQIVSEEVAAQIQGEIQHRRSFEPMSQVRPTPSAALLAMKPSTGVKRNNATANADGSGNTAHKKSDVNSKEWISIPPSYDPATQSWTATYPHLLCTTRQKDALLDTRSSAQTGKRPLFYFHVKAEIFGFTGIYQNAHTLSMPFAIATRRNQDCQVQRMMSSYTATCFWLYGTAIVDGITWKHFKELYAQYFAMNSEVNRSLVEEDFNVLEQKMHCPECEEVHYCLSQTPAQQQQSQMITFKNVLCPHLHYQVGKTDVRFSVWRGMLELLHLFSDQKTELKNMWESGLLLGFMERDKVNALLSEMDSGMIMHLSFIVGGCVLLNVKSSNGNQILNLEPLDLKRLQSKSLHEYLRDVLIAEKIDYILNSNHEWICVEEAMKLCQKSADAYLQSHPGEREITSNVTHSDKISVQETLRFTPMRVAVVTCKVQKTPEELAQEIPTLPTYTNEEFEQNLEKLMYRYGKTRMDVINLLNRKAITSAASVESPVQPPTISCVQLPTISTAPLQQAANQQQQPVTTSDFSISTSFFHKPAYTPDSLNNLYNNGRFVSPKQLKPFTQRLRPGFDSQQQISSPLPKQQKLELISPLAHPVSTIDNTTMLHAMQSMPHAQLPPHLSTTTAPCSIPFWSENSDFVPNADNKSTMNLSAPMSGPPNEITRFHAL